MTPPQCCPLNQPRLQPPPPPLPWPATDEQPLAKNADLYNFAIFLSFLKIFDIFWFLSALRVKEPPLGFKNRLLRSF